MTKMAEQGISIPLIAIGGITAADIHDIMQTGVSGIAVSGAVLKASSPVDEMKRLLDIMKTVENENRQ